MKAKQLLLLTAVLALCSCSGSSNSEPEQVPVLFSADILSVQSRATDTGFETNDQIGVFVTEWGGSSQTTLKASGNYADNKLYSYSGSGFTGTTVYYPQSGNKIDVYAYYPYVGSASATGVSFAVKSNQSTASEYTKSDLMTAGASGRSTSTSPIPLAFTHALSRIVINLDGATVPKGTTTVSLGNVYAGCTLNLATGTCTTSGSKSSVIMKSNGTNSFVAILPPQSFTAGQILATITIGGENYTWKPSQQLDLIKNTESSYTLYFEEDKEPVNFTATINPWEKAKIDQVVPPELQSKIREYMPIYTGTTPPNVVGVYLVNPVKMIYSTQTNDNYDMEFADKLLKLSNQNTTANTLDYDSEQASEYLSGKGYFISGTGMNFTVFFNTTGTSSGISMKTATVISGTKTAQGISNFHNAFLMLEKGADPTGKLVPVGTIRVFKDNNGLASNSAWTRSQFVSTGYSMSEMWKN